MPGGTIRYVPLHPPKDGATRTSSASEWTIDFDQLEKTINSKTKMIVCIVKLLDLVIKLMMTMADRY
jgi:kynurenine aminotransferase